ncbi:uncharacterized protein LOC114295820 [Camellia sinensis]|uniref:uncharacterized protein LOC114295820 n=1 Tax=Camellia sinensis TaxID=4442 RepID=UPI001036E2EC|nr:uncharacterized protein LOC114295820 [Camellia sinensis]
MEERGRDPWLAEARVPKLSNSETDELAKTGGISLGAKGFGLPGKLSNVKVIVNGGQRVIFKKNYEVMNNLGVKNITNSLMSVVQPKCANAKEKGIRVEVDDDDEYNPSGSENDSDNESLGSFYRKEQEMPPGLRLQPYSRPLTPTLEEGMDPPRQEIGTQPLPPHNVQPVHEVTASSSVASHDRRGRGPTRGIQTQRIVQKNGKMLVPVPEHFRAPVGDQASKLASKIGIEVRTQLPDLSICRWNKVHDADKKPMIQRLEDQFDLQGNPSDVARTLNTQFGPQLSSFT